MTVPLHQPALLDAGIGELGAIGSDGAAISDWADHHDSVVRRNRWQLVQTWPVLAVFAAEVTLPPAVVIAIDESKPLIDGLASIAGVNRETVRFLRQKSPLLLGRSWLTDPIELLRVISLMPSHRRPVSAAEWRIASQLWEGVGLAGNGAYTLRLFPRQERDLLAEHLFTGLCALGLENVQRRLDKRWHGNLTRLGDVKDYFQFVSDWCSVGGGLGIPNAFVAVIARTTLGHALVKCYPAMELIRQSEHWHRIMGKRLGGTEPDAGIGWPALFPQPVHCDDLTVTSLTTSLDIQQEGYRLQHCVGNYVRGCLSGRSHVVSVRDASGASLSTAEIKLTRSYGATVSTQVIQHRAMDNGEPPSSCAAALHVAMKALQSAAGQSHLREIVAIYQEQAPSFQHYHPNLKDSSFDPVMREVLPDFDRAVVWLERRLLEEEAWYRHHNESLWSVGTPFHVLTPLNNPQGNLRITYEVHDCWP